MHTMEGKLKLSNALMFKAYALIHLWCNIVAYWQAEFVRILAEYLEAGFRNIPTSRSYEFWKCNEVWREEDHL